MSPVLRRLINVPNVIHNPEPCAICLRDLTYSSNNCPHVLNNNDTESPQSMTTPSATSHIHSIGRLQSESMGSNERNLIEDFADYGLIEDYLHLGLEEVDFTRTPYSSLPSYFASEASHQPVHLLPIPDPLPIPYLLPAPNLPLESESSDCASPNTLCKECEHIHDLMQRQRLTSNNNEYGSMLAPLPHISATSECTMCKFLYEMRWSLPQALTYHLHAFSILRLVYGQTLVEFNREQASWSRVLADNSCFAVLPYSGRVLVSNAVGLSAGNSFFMANKPENREALQINGYLINKETVDYEILKSWIAQCSDKYACGPKTGKLGTTTPLYFIDCDTRRILHWKSKKRVKYVALSYVWGNMSETFASEDFLEQLPTVCATVIEDAIIVTKNLGYRFLWIDRYCVSRDPSIRHQQIARMDWIYKHSEVTIIAASGSHASQGLPGVSGVSRYDQPLVHVRDQTYVSMLPSLNSLLERSIYETRGWTYQEKFFSSRQLIFTHHQVYYRCARQTVSEAVYIHPTSFPKHKYHVEERKEHDLRDKFLRHSQLPRSNHVYQPDGSVTLAQVKNWMKPYTLTLFEHHVSQYTQRHLTYDCDSLVAVQSILDRFQHEELAIEHMCGIPFKPNPDVVYMLDTDGNKFQEEWDFNILSGLAWTHGSANKPIRRRGGFPSWSWAGWEGPVTWLLNDLREGVVLDADPKIYYPKAELSASNNDENLLRWSKWRTREGHHFPSCLRIERQWLHLRVIKSEPMGHESDTYRIAPAYPRDTFAKPNTADWPHYMVHLTLPEEDAIRKEAIRCLGTEIAQDLQRQLVYLLLVYEVPSTPDMLANSYERLGMVIVDLAWYTEQRKHEQRLWLA